MSVVMVQGSHLKWNRPGHAALQATHPIFAECEKILMDRDCILLGGPQGAYLLKLCSGEVIDLFAGAKISETAGKTRKIYDLGQNRLLATASFGTFLSIDGGEWEPVKSDWSLVRSVLCCVTILMSQ